MLAQLLDVVEACDAIGSCLAGVDLDMYCATRFIRSSVEREVILIGAALASLLRVERDLPRRLPHSRPFVDLGDRLEHGYYAVSRSEVWSIATDEVPLLRDECRAILAEREGEGEGDED